MEIDNGGQRLKGCATCQSPQTRMASGADWNISRYTLTDSHPGKPAFCVCRRIGRWCEGRDIVASIAALVNLLVGFSLYALLGLSAGSLYELSVAIGYLAGMAVNWSLNRVVTFPNSGRRWLAEIRTFS